MRQGRKRSSARGKNVLFAYFLRKFDVSIFLYDKDRFSLRSKYFIITTCINDRMRN